MTIPYKIKTNNDNNIVGLDATIDTDTRFFPFAERDIAMKWHTIHLSAWNHINEAFGTQLIAGAVSPGVAQERLDEWGEDDPRYISRIEGRFPPAGENVMISLSDIDAAMDKKAIPQCTFETPVGAIGIDFARFGQDASVCYSIRNGVAKKEFAIYGIRDLKVGGGRDLINRLTALFEDDDIQVLAVDADGIGNYMPDMIPVPPKKHIIEYHAGGKSEEQMLAEHIATVYNPDLENTKVYELKYKNRATESWWHVSQSLRRKEIVIADDKDNRTLRRELGNRLYEYDGTNNMVLESKDKYKDRTEQASPDYADGFVITHTAYRKAIELYEKSLNSWE